MNALCFIAINKYQYCNICQPNHLNTLFVLDIQDCNNLSLDLALLYHLNYHPHFVFLIIYGRIFMRVFFIVFCTSNERPPLSQSSFERSSASSSLRYTNQRPLDSTGTSSLVTFSTSLPFHNLNHPCGAIPLISPSLLSWSIPSIDSGFLLVTEKNVLSLSSSAKKLRLIPSSSSLASSNSLLAGILLTRFKSSVNLSSISTSSYLLRGESSKKLSERIDWGFSSPKSGSDTVTEQRLASSRVASNHAVLHVIMTILKNATMSNPPNAHNTASGISEHITSCARST